MNVGDDLYLGSDFTLGLTNSENPTLNQGCGPLGRIAVRNIVPLTKSTTNIATAQHLTNGTPLTLTAGTGITKTTAPDGTTVYALDCARCIALTSSASQSSINMTLKGYDEYWQPMTQTLALAASASTVNTTKAFRYLASATPSATDGTNTTSIGTADIFGLQFAVPDAGYIAWNRWAETLAEDAGTFVAADQTIPATVSTGDVRGTYAPSSASNGTRRLIIGMHLNGSQCGQGCTEFSYVNGASVTVTGAIGVQQV